MQMLVLLLALLLLLLLTRSFYLWQRGATQRTARKTESAAAEQIQRSFRRYSRNEEAKRAQRPVTPPVHTHTDPSLSVDSLINLCC